MKKLSGFPAWMLFVFTCFLNWAAIFTAGILSGNKKWMLIGGLYALPLVFIITVAITDEDTQQRLKIEKRLKSGIALSETEKITYAQALIAIKQIEENQAELDTLTEFREKQELKKANSVLEKRVDESIKVVIPDETSWLETFAITLWLLSSLAAFVHAWIIKPKYWLILQEKERVRREATEETRRFAMQNPKANMLHHKLMQDVIQTKNDILRKIGSSDNIDTFLSDDIKNMTENFTEQIKLLVEKDKKLTLQINPKGAEKAEIDLSKLEKQRDNSDDVRLLNEIQTAIDSKQRLVNSYKEMKVTHDTIKLRLDTAVSSLKQVKFDLIKLEGVFNDEQKKQFFTDFEDKANELSGYVEAIKESYE